jgi:hypothetical protein
MMIKMMMIMSILLLGSTGYLAADPESPHVLEARGIVKQFFGSLKDELQAALKEGGPVTAISICKLKAPKISKEFTLLSGWYVGRTTLRLRNPNNEPDAWEQKVLEQFESRIAAGEDISKMEHAEEILMDGKKIFRYMQAIQIQDLCLNCHGGDIKPGIARILTQLYPNDQATGFRKGDLRGAFSLAKSL